MVLNRMELNHNLLHTMFQFKPLSRLNNFLISKTGVNKPFYSLLEILIIFRDVIKMESMFDPNNVSVILCSSELKDTLNVKAFHLSHLKGLISTHVTNLQDQNLDDKVTNHSYNKFLDADLTPNTIIRHASLSISSLTHKDARCTLQPSFLKVIQSVNGTDSGKTVFSYSEVTTLLSMYILSSKDHLFDHRNTELALVDGDALGSAFGLMGFHRSQLTKLVKSQLISVDNDSPPDVTVVTSSCSPGLTVRVIYLD